MWDWLEDILGLKQGVRTGAVDSLFGPAVSSAVDSRVQSPFIRNVPPKPPQIQGSNNFYDEGSKYREARDQAGALGRSQGDMPSLSEILSKLEALGDPTRYAMSQDQLMSQARAGASAQYDPVIAQLRGAQNQAKTRGEQNRQRLGEMFGQLSTSLQGDIAPLEQKAAQTRQATQGQFDTLKQDIQGTYDSSQAEQEAMMKRLNIQAAAPTVLAGQQRDEDYFTNRTNTDQNTALTALDQENRGNVEYTRRGSEVARIEGTQRQSDLMAELEQVLGAYQNQIGANEAAKASAVQKMFGELSGQSSDQAYKLAQRDFDNYKQSIELGRMLSNDQYSRSKTGGVDSTKSLADVGGRAMTLGLPNSSAQRLQDVFQSAIGGDQRILGGLNPDTGQALNDYQMAQYIMEAGRQQGLSPQELNALQAIALEYFK